MCEAEGAYIANLNKNLVHWVSNEIPWQTTYHMCHYDSLLEEVEYALCALPGVDSWMFVPDFSQTLPHADSTLYHLLYKPELEGWLYAESSNPPSESSNLGMVLENLWKR